MLILPETMAEECHTAAAPEPPESLITRSAGGDQEALAEPYHRTWTSVYGLALSCLKSQHDAEDVAQNALAQTWENAHQYHPQGIPLTWLLTAARNLALIELRKRGKTQDTALEDWERLTAKNPMVTMEDRQVLDAALTVLADDEQQIVPFHAVTGWKHREIAGLLELPLSTVLSEYRRVPLKLKMKLEGGDAL